MTTTPDPITLPCVCHVPPPEGTVRIEIRQAKKGEVFWHDFSRNWQNAMVDHENYETPVAILAPQYDYPTPIEACRMLAEEGGPIECEFSDDGIVWETGNFSGCLPWSGPYSFWVEKRGWYAKIRIPKRG